MDLFLMYKLFCFMIYVGYSFFDLKWGDYYIVIRYSVKVVIEWFIVL